MIHYWNLGRVRQIPSLMEFRATPYRSIFRMADRVEYERAARAGTVYPEITIRIYRVKSIYPVSTVHGYRLQSTRITLGTKVSRTEGRKKKEANAPAAPACPDGLAQG